MPPLECLLPGNFLNDYGGAFHAYQGSVAQALLREPVPARRPAHILVFRQVTSGQQSAGKMVTHAQLEDVMTVKERGEVIKNRRRQQNVFLFSHKGFLIMKEESVIKSA